MKLKNKILISISLIWANFLIITYIAAHFFLLHSFQTLENERATRDLNRVNQALKQNSSTLYTYATDWSHWTDAYRFMEGKNPLFIANNFKIPAFINSDINLMTYWNKEGNQVAGKAINTSTQQYTSYPKGLEHYIYPGSSFVTTHKNSRGFILTADGIMVLASTTITDGDARQPPLGMAIAGRLLSPDIIQRINATTQVNTVLFLPDQIAENPALSNIFKTTAAHPEKSIIIPYDKNILHGYIVIKDLYGEPIGMLQTTTTPLIYLSGLKVINYFIISFITLGILFSIFMLWLLRVLIVNRVESLDHEVAKISKNNILSQRVNAQGNDEIFSLANQINSMMDIIETSREKLELRVKERTQELQKINIQMQQEIVERKSIEKELTTHKEHLVRLAHYDSLTALPNRFFFNEMLSKKINHAKRKRSKFSILYIDLDNFKTINDTLGHLVGDSVLKEIANRFLKTLRSSDILARLSGDEFIILLNDIEDTQFANTIAEKILTICSNPIKANNHECVLTASIGICTYPEDGASLENLLKNADMALYKAKQEGGNVFHFYTKEMDIDTHERIQLEAALRNAIKNNEFLIRINKPFKIYPLSRRNRLNFTDW